MELPNIAAYAYQDVHVWSALLTCLRPPARTRISQWENILQKGIWIWLFLAYKPLEFWVPRSPPQPPFKENSAQPPGGEPPPPPPPGDQRAPCRHRRAARPRALGQGDAGARPDPQGLPDQTPPPPPAHPPPVFERVPVMQVVSVLVRLGCVQEFCPQQHSASECTLFLA